MSFNVALLAKQGLRLLTQLDYLLTHVLKAKYFPNGCFLLACMGFNPSFTWCSLMGARGLLHLGTGWRISIGESVNIWNDHWILGLRDG